MSGAILYALTALNSAAVVWLVATIRRARPKGAGFQPPHDRKTMADFERGITEAARQALKSGGADE